MNYRNVLFHVIRSQFCWNADIFQFIDLIFIDGRNALLFAFRMKWNYRGYGFCYVSGKRNCTIEFARLQCGRVAEKIIRAGIEIACESFLEVCRLSRNKSSFNLAYWLRAFDKYVNKSVIAIKSINQTFSQQIPLFAFFIFNVCKYARYALCVSLKTHLLNKYVSLRIYLNYYWKRVFSLALLF